jgi:hypothetical protein
MGWLCVAETMSCLLLALRYRSTTERRYDYRFVNGDGSEFASPLQSPAYHVRLAVSQYCKATFLPYRTRFQSCISSSSLVYDALSAHMLSTAFEVC